MPFLSPSGSPTTSPRSKAVSSFETVPSVQQQGSPFITYIPPLIDGVCGTTPNSPRSISQQLRNDLSQLLGLVPSLLRGAVAARMGLAETISHVSLAFLETSIVLSAIPLWLALPGAAFAAWVVGCSALVVGMSWCLNGRGLQGQVLRSSSPTADGWTIGQEIDDEQWFYVEGMGMSSRTLTDKTLPALARLFSRTVVAVHEPTYGLLFDFLLLLLKRCLNTIFPHSIASRALYSQIRTALLDNKSNRTVILAHNVGAITVSQILRQLYSEIPTEKMTKLEIYTFGAAAVEFVMPLGGRLGDTKTNNKQQDHVPKPVSDRHGPHIEHFAFTNDPFARMGVLRSVYEDLAGRFCGSIFMLHCPGAVHHAPATPRGRRSSHSRGKAVAEPAKIEKSSRPLMSLTDYISCLFPDHSLTNNLSSSESFGQTTGSILDDIMTIDRSLAEKREFAALAKDPIVYGSKANSKRISWTGLGATVNGKYGNEDGLRGLEVARKGCKDCNGHRGREVSRLVGYVCIPSQFNDYTEKTKLWGMWT
ncbi:unnamed protein product [Discula destructiva]